MSAADFDGAPRAQCAVVAMRERELADPLQCDEPEDYRSFRLGLFGLDKLQNVERTVESLRATLDRVI